MASSLSKSIQLNTRLLNALKHHISQSYELELLHTCTRMFRCFLGFITLLTRVLSDHFPGTVFVLLFDLFRCADGLCFCIRLSQQYHKIVWWYVNMSILSPVAPASTASKASTVSTLPHLVSASTLSIFDDNLHPGGNNLITVQLYDKVVKGKKIILMLKEAVKNYLADFVR